MKKLLFTALCFSSIMAFGQELRNKVDGGFVFTDLVSMEATNVKNQNKSGTCWSFSGLSLFESEMIRMGMEPFDFSEMFVVRKAYEMKANNYVQLHGKAQIGPGGQFHDIIEVAQDFGMLKEADYGGQPIAYGKPHHNEMDAMVKAMLGVVIKNPNRKLSPYWKDAYSGMLDAYLGPIPTSIDPKTVAESSKLEWDKYIEITSFSHLPFYEKSVLLIPDNWTFSSYYNVPLTDLFGLAISALDAGFTLGWDADVSNRGFSFKNGVAIQPDEPWATMSKTRRDTIFKSPSEELVVSQELRQEMFDNYSTTDDHLMHLTGYCKDQNGTVYFQVKNSWGSEKNDCGGYLYVSEAYFKANTIAVMLHKDGLQKSLSKKLKL